jgi:hypothetical protein
MSVDKSVLNVYLAGNQGEFDAITQPAWSRQHDQMRDFDGYRTWVPLGNMEEPLDVPDILRSGGHFTDWELGFNGYASNYISVPTDPGSLRGSY